MTGHFSPKSVFFLFITFVSLLFGAPNADAAPAGAVFVKAGQVFAVGEVTCALVKRKFLPGKMVSARRFLSHAQERKNILATAAKASGKKKKGLLAKASRLQALIRSIGAVCDSGPTAAQAPTPIAVPPAVGAEPTIAPIPPLATVAPTSTYTATPTWFFPNFPSSSPTPTRTATPSPTPSKTSTPTVTPTPTATPTSTWSSAPGAIPISSYSQLTGAEIYASDGQFLGIFADSFQSNSLGNEYGSYGSSFSATSIFNNYGAYGSRYAAKSAFNSYSSTPPVLFLNSEPVAFLTTNALRTPRVDTYDVAYWLGRLDDAP